MKTLLRIIALAGALTLAVSLRAQTGTAPKSVIHVVTVAWKAGTTPEQIQAALDGVKALPAKFDGIKRVWVKSIKVQGGKANAFVMEFADEAALKTYAGSDAQKEWYKTYMPIRQESTTFDITN
ncbi:MAG TPA: Dabb family protein [Opitutus sp.]|nr:Dabb family protein [Opitutus sp.]